MWVAIAAVVVTSFLGGILFDRWMMGEPRKYREAHEHYPAQYDDEVAKARMRGQAQL